MHLFGYVFAGSRLAAEVHHVVHKDLHQMIILTGQQLSQGTVYAAGCQCFCFTGWPESQLQQQVAMRPASSMVQLRSVVRLALL
jgi:hypothetical protein